MTAGDERDLGEDGQAADDLGIVLRADPGVDPVEDQRHRRAEQEAQAAEEGHADGPALGGGEPAPGLLRDRGLEGDHRLSAAGPGPQRLELVVSDAVLVDQGVALCGEH